MSSSLKVMGILVIGLLTIGPAQAQQYRDDGYRDDSRDDAYRSDDNRYNDDPRTRDDVGYDYARVVRVDPIIVRDASHSAARCYNRPVQGNYGGSDGYYGNGAPVASNAPGRSLATVIGGVAGAVVGSRFGGGSGQLLGTAVGTVAGGLAGQSVYDANHPQSRDGYVQVCDPVAEEREQVDGYDVTYEYGGRTYHTRSDFNPGDRIRVRVEAAPE